MRTARGTEKDLFYPVLPVPLISFVLEIESRALCMLGVFYYQAILAALPSLHKSGREPYIFYGKQSSRSVVIPLKKITLSWN